MLKKKTAKPKEKPAVEKNKEILANAQVVISSVKEYTAKKDGSAWVVYNPDGSVNRVYKEKDAEDKARGYTMKLNSK